MRGLLLWLAMAGAATAQDLPFDPAPMAKCVDQAETMLDAQGCVGMAAQACMDAPGGETTVGMSYCYGDELGYWDTRLNAAYNELMRNDKVTDAEVASSGVKTPSIADALRDMQRAWIAFRDASCNYERATWTNGSGAGPAAGACLMQLTAEQALVLEGRLYDAKNQ